MDCVSRQIIEKGPDSVREQRTEGANACNSPKIWDAFKLLWFSTLSFVVLCTLRQEQVVDLIIADDLQDDPLWSKQRRWSFRSVVEVPCVEEERQSTVCLHCSVLSSSLPVRRVALLACSLLHLQTNHHQ